MGIHAKRRIYMMWRNGENKNIIRGEKIMKFKKFIITMMTGCMILTCAGCGASGEMPSTEAASTPVDMSIESSVEEVCVEPIQSMYDVNDLSDSEFAASFTVDDVKTQENQTSIHLTAYDYELFNASEIESLKAGDILVIDRNEMKVESVEPQGDSWIQINGGLDQDGCDLCKGEDGLYYEMQLESKSYQPMTELDLPLAKDFVFVDSSDPEKQGQKYNTEEFLDLLKDDVYGFYPNNSTVTVENGEISQITRNFIP